MGPGFDSQSAQSFALCSYNFAIFEFRTWLQDAFYYDFIVSGTSVMPSPQLVKEKASEPAYILYVWSVEVLPKVFLHKFIQW